VKYSGALIGNCHCYRSNTKSLLSSFALPHLLDLQFHSPFFILPVSDTPFIVCVFVLCCFIFSSRNTRHPPRPIPPIARSPQLSFWPPRCPPSPSRSETFAFRLKQNTHLNSRNDLNHLIHHVFLQPRSRLEPPRRQWCSPSPNSWPPLIRFHYRR